MSTTKPQTPQSILIMGGTFDPIHIGHTSTAQETAQWLGINQITLIPAHIPPHKSGTFANASHRQAMVNLLCQEDPIFSLDTRELKQTRASYTIDTLRDITVENPNTKIYFIMGMDSLLSFQHWHHWREIISLCNIVVNVRPGYDNSALQEQLPQKIMSCITGDLNLFKQATHSKIILRQGNTFDVSSTKIRANIKADIAIDNLLSSCVSQYIKQHKLYR